MKFRLGAQFANILNHPQFIPGSNPGFGLGVNDVASFTTTKQAYRSYVTPGKDSSINHKTCSPAMLGPLVSSRSSSSNSRYLIKTWEARKSLLFHANNLVIEELPETERSPGGEPSSAESIVRTMFRAGRGVFGFVAHVNVGGTAPSPTAGEM